MEVVRNYVTGNFQIVIKPDFEVGTSRHAPRNMLRSRARVEMMSQLKGVFHFRV